MTVRVLAPAAGGAAYLYHTAINPDGSTWEHFFIGRVRQTTTSHITYCHLCDSVSVIPRTNGDEHARALTTYVAKGQIVPVALADAPDPLDFAKADLVDDAVAQIGPITPEDSTGRRDARARLKPAHTNVKP